MIRGLLLILCSIAVPFFTAAQDALWSDVQHASVQSYTQRNSDVLPTQYRLVKLDRKQAVLLQQQAPLEKTALANKNMVPVLFDVPLPKGGKQTSSFLESPVLSSELQSLNPGIKTYELTNPQTKNSNGRITITPQGISGLIFTDNGTVYISPLGNDYPDVHMVYYIKDLKPADAVTCGVQEELANMKGGSVLAGDCQLRTYRLAVAATGEYTTWAGSQPNAIGYITTTVNNVTAIYEQDAAIRFTLVTNNSVIFTNAGTDPYATVASPDGTTLNTNNTTLNTNIGSGNYDLGIVFNDDWNGGLAQLSSVCGASKGRAAAGLTFGTGANPVAGPQGPVFDGTVAHEIGHQFSATHTHNATNGGCGPPNVTAASAWEPGGGSTIMAYTNVCTGNFYQAGSDLYFHSGNIQQIQTFAFGTACPVVTPLANNAPSVSVAAASYTIPISTPFTLDATATDADGNNLTYSWEQLDAGFTSAAPPASTNVSGPLFRPYPATSSSSRTFPRIDDIVNGVSPAYEVLPSVARTMNFQVIVRDNAAGGACTDEATVALTTDAGSGPFTVTSQSTPETWTADGVNTAAITWNVAGTNAAPVNCSNVDILLSIDGGITYPYTLLAGTANDGSENILIPNLPTLVGRIKVQASNNVFFNINSAFITITSACSAEGAEIDPGTTVTETAGSSNLNLSLSPLYGSVVTPTGTLTAGDPGGLLAVNDNVPGVCAAFGNNFQYQTFQFYVNVAGSYTFTRSGGTSGLIIFNLYTNSFTPGSPCNNFINSNGTFVNPPGTVSISSNFSANLTPGVLYTLAVGTFNTGSPALPSNFTINVTPPGGGNIFDATYFDPGAGFSYAYVIVDDATGNIVDIDQAPGPDLSNSGVYATGTYTIYGLSYDNSISLPTLNSYIGGAYSALENDALYNPGTFCSNLSKNTVAVNILASLPAQLLPLQAYKMDNSVLLSWGTASEQNTAHFEVLRSSDGVHFEKTLGTVKARGNSSSTIKYSFTDNTPDAAINYYRIRQVDLDGKSKLSNIASVNMAQPFRAATVYPNPASTTITLEYFTDKREVVQVQIVDSKGAVVATTRLNAQTGRNTGTINIAGLANGVYAVRATGSTGTHITRFVKK